MFYPNQEDEFIIGTLGSPVTLTNLFADNISDPFEIVHYLQLTFCVDYTAGADGSGSYIEIKVEGSPDLLDNDSVTPAYYQETASLTSGGTITHTAAVHKYTNATGGSTASFFFYVPPAFKILRVSIREVKAASDDGTATIRLIASGK